MSEDDIIDTFDSKVTSFWVAILLGASKSLEWSLTYLNRYGAVEVTVAGYDVTMLALYASLMCAGTTALIAWKTAKQ